MADKKRKKRKMRAGYLLLFDWSESFGTRPACALYSERGRKRKKKALSPSLSYINPKEKVKFNMAVKEKPDFRLIKTREISRNNNNNNKVDPDEDYQLYINKKIK